MKLDQLQRHWDAFGKLDPLWAILTWNGHEEGRWKLDEFLATGREEVAELMEHLERLELRVERGRALDFGCGIGRLTQALCDHFDRCDGVDIAPSMIARARAANRYGERCQYHVNDRPDLRLFGAGSFDLVLSIIVLQHMEPAYSTRYMREFIRVLRPGGVAVFQVPWGHRPTPLDDGAWRARLEVATPPGELPGGRRHTLSVRVRNDSECVWPSGAAIHLGNHWLDVSERRIRLDDGRTPVTEELAPGEETRLLLGITPPGPGRHLLELDLVQEGVAWFADRGSPTARIPVRVQGRGVLRRMVRRLPGGGGGEEPVMEMHCVPREEVVALVAEEGATVVDTLDRDSCSGGYQSLHYLVRKSD